jgi:hypothetical protein
MRYVVSTAPSLRARFAWFLVLSLNLLGTTPRAAQAAFASIVNYALPNPAGFTNAQPYAIGAGQTIGAVNSPNEHAIIWTAPFGNIIDLNPSSITYYSSGLGTDGANQVGYGGGSGTGNVSHALLWSGTAASAVDLNPTLLGSFTSSYAYAVSGNQQAGYGFGAATDGNNHALLWTGTSASAVDLNPSGAVDSEALANTNGQQAGYASVPNQHAFLWTGTAASGVDLNPSGISSSSVYGMGGGQQVGQGGNHAYLWTGSAASAVDLNPTGFNYSKAVSTNGTQQVGYGFGSNTGGYNALFWSGSADSFVNLQSYLPAADSWTSSQAYSVDSAGHIYGIATGTVNGVSGQFAIEWVELPEPGTFAFFGIVAGGVLLRRSTPRIIRKTA